jgi:crotonobetaine/carnitine-CoA ligase
VPVNSKVLDADLVHILRDSGATHVVTVAPLAELVDRATGELGADVTTIVLGSDASPSEWERYLSRPVAHGVVEVRDDDLANLQYTSGTTGLPKACMLSHRYWLDFGSILADSWGVRDDDVDLTAQAFSYVDPMWNVSLCLVAGIPLVILPRFSASRFWSDVRANGVTFFYCIATMPVYMFAQPADAADRDNKVRFVYCSAIPKHLHRAFEERWGQPWRETYGSTEMGCDTVAPVDDDASVGTGSVGRLVATKEARLVGPAGQDVGDGEVGELWVRGRPAMKGYWNNPEATAAVLDADGWFHTGDLAHRDARGDYYLAGRVKEVIRRGGENISAAEVESVIATFDGIELAAVIGLEDEALGEEVKAFVQPTSGRQVDPAELHAYLSARIARFKVPRFIAVSPSLPLTVSEKVAKNHLRQDRTTPTWDAKENSWN